MLVALAPRSPFVRCLHCSHGVVLMVGKLWVSVGLVEDVTPTLLGQLYASPIRVDRPGKGSHPIADNSLDGEGLLHLIQTLNLPGEPIGQRHAAA
jgi:hypothetical protein